MMASVFCAALELQSTNGDSLAMGAKEVNKAIQYILATLLNIELLKLEQEECLRHFAG